MKKLLLLLVGGGIALGANAQYSSNASVVRGSRTAKTTARPTQKTAHASAQMVAASTVNHGAAKTTASCFASESFGTANVTGLPAGWSNTTITPAGSPGWHWSATASTAAFSLGVMNSTTASNGWMIYDSDSIGSASGGTAVPNAYLQTSAFNCTGHSTVRLNFEDYYEKFNDSCFVWVSTSPTFATYTSFPVLENNLLSTNVVTANTAKVHINISSVAANQPAVYIRFVYSGPAGGGYAWMIDDVCLSELDPVDVSVQKGGIVYDGGTDVGLGSPAVMPLSFVAPLIPVAFTNNYGNTAEPTTTVNAKIYQGTTSVYDQNTVVNLPLAALDTVAEMPTTYTPTAIGTYRVPFAISVPGTPADADATNDKDTTNFAITDTLFSQNFPGSSISGGVVVHRSTAPAISFTPGTSFVIPSGKSDTLTGVSVAFTSTTAAGQNVGAQIFHFTGGTGGTWEYDGTTVFRNLSASDVSTSSSTVFAYFKVDPLASGHQIVIDGGTGGKTYAVVIKGNNNTGNVAVLQGENPAPEFVEPGIIDTSNNDGSASQQFGQGHLPFSNALTPLVRMHFGSVDYTAVNDINANLYAIGNAYPNPANSAVTVPFTMKENATVTVTLSNVVGQVIGTQTINAQSGVAAKATFATSTLPSGVYMYTVMVNGQQKTGRVSIAH